MGHAELMHCTVCDAIPAMHNDILHQKQLLQCIAHALPQPRSAESHRHLHYRIYPRPPHANLPATRIPVVPVTPAQLRTSATALSGSGLSRGRCMSSKCTRCLMSDLNMPGTSSTALTCGRHTTRCLALRC